MDYARYLAQLNAGYRAAKQGSPFSSCMSELWQQGYNDYKQLEAELPAKGDARAKTPPQYKPNK